jgi:nicotinate-nucleotide adenylyltransferase
MSSTDAIIYGGTFDPPHRAHIELPRLSAAAVGCGRIIYMPATVNPLKAEQPPTPAHHRLAMLELALRDLPGTELSTLELDRAGPSYTIDTVRALRRSMGPTTRLRLLIGADQALEFHRWREWGAIMELALPLVMLRPPWDRGRFERELAARYEPAEAERWRMAMVDLPLMDMESSAIRRMLAAGAADAAFSHLLDGRVLAYIRAHGLYRSDH